MAQAKNYVKEAADFGIKYDGRIGDLGCGYNDAEQLVPITHALSEYYKVEIQSITAAEFDEEAGRKAAARYESLDVRIGPDQGDITKQKYGVNVAFMAAILAQIGILDQALKTQDSPNVVIYGFDQWKKVAKDDVRKMLSQNGYSIKEGGSVLVGEKK